MTRVIIQKSLLTLTLLCPPFVYARLLGAPPMGEREIGDKFN
jgi:hypothetical protein